MERRRATGLAGPPEPLHGPFMKTLAPRKRARASRGLRGLSGAPKFRDLYTLCWGWVEGCRISPDFGGLQARFAFSLAWASRGLQEPPGPPGASRGLGRVEGVLQTSFPDFRVGPTQVAGGRAVPPDVREEPGGALDVHSP